MSALVEQGQPIPGQLVSPPTIRADLAIRDSLASYEQLRIYNAFIQITYNMRIGQYKAAGDILQTLQSHLTRLADLVSVDAQPLRTFFTFGTYNLPYLAVVCHILCAIHSRTIGDVPRAVFSLAKATEVIESELLLIYSASSTGDITAERMDEVRALVRMKFMVHENLFYIKITRFDLEAAFIELQNTLHLNRTYPYLFIDVGENVIHTLAALYLQAIGHIQSSRDHINVALRSSKRFDLQILSIIRLVVCTLYLGEIDMAKLLIKDYLGQLENHPQLIFKCATLLLDGVVRQYTAPNEAKDKFKECLAILNKSFTHSQLTMNVLYALTRLYIAHPPTSSDSAAQASITSMIDTSLTLATVNNDFIGQLCAILGSLKQSNDKLIFLKTLLQPSTGTPQTTPKK
eukprot:gene7708-9026_t